MYRGFAISVVGEAFEDIRVVCSQAADEMLNITGEFDINFAFIFFVFKPPEYTGIRFFVFSKRVRSEINPV